MKKKILAAVCCASMIGCLAATPVLADETVKADGDYKIALITMDSVDQHWVSLKEGAEEEAKADGVTDDFMAPDVKDDAKQIECINNAVAGGYDAILVAANSEDAVSGALQEAVDAGIKIVYVDSPANVEAEATFSTDNKAAGKTAGEEMTTEIVVSVITLIGTLVTVWGGNKLTAYRIEQLEQKVNKHNNLIERTFKIEERLSTDEEKLKVANHRIDDLEHKVDI